MCYANMQVPALTSLLFLSHNPSPMSSSLTLTIYSGGTHQLAPLPPSTYRLTFLITTEHPCQHLLRSEAGNKK